MPVDFELPTRTQNYEVPTRAHERDPVGAVMVTITIRTQNQSESRLEELTLGTLKACKFSSDEPLFLQQQKFQRLSDAGVSF